MLAMSDLVQTTFDYEVLTYEQAQRTQDAEIRIIGRTQKAIIDNGRDLLAVKADIGHGHFLNWVQSIGISHYTADSWMNAAKNFGQITDNQQFESRALYLLSTSKVPESAREEAKRRAEDGEKITEEIAKQIRDAHKAVKQAEENVRQARAEAFASQQQLFQLKQKMESLSEPEVQIIEKPVVPQEVATRLEQLSTEVTKLTQQRDTLSQRAQTLGAELEAQRDANEARRQQEQYVWQIRENWRKTTDGFRKNVLPLLGQFPSSVDTQVFEPDDWTRLEQTRELARRFLEECDRLRMDVSFMVVDAE